MSKSQLIDQIRHHNRQVTSEFLMHFDRGALNHYLEHLRYLTQPRNSACWIRDGETPAVVTRPHRTTARAA